MYLSQTAPKVGSKQFFLLLLCLNKEMASSIEEILAFERTRVTLERTLQVTNNFSKFVNKSEVPLVNNSEVPLCAAILLSAIDFSSVLFRKYEVSFKSLKML